MICRGPFQPLRFCDSVNLPTHRENAKTTHDLKISWQLSQRSSQLHYFLAFDIKISSERQLLMSEPFIECSWPWGCRAEPEDQRAWVHLKGSKLESQDKGSWIFLVIIFWSLPSLAALNTSYLCPLNHNHFQWHYIWLHALNLESGHIQSDWKGLNACLRIWGK